MRERVVREPAVLPSVVGEVARHDAPVQNTRRWVAAAGVVGGQAMVEGDAVLVVLAAANRDPAANSNPDRFDTGRRERRAFTFGLGAHACPGEAVAVTIASAGVATYWRRASRPSAWRRRRPTGCPSTRACPSSEESEDIVPTRQQIIHVVQVPGRALPSAAG